ncbi:hypothetical protein MHBO_000222 [Bonamia ostreae]|uniref:DNA-directed RNA polymerase III subunit RPC4 n=1 Tax=Bonamia ostreae TaxID=126728 RepID=A0ABV2AEU6_9EUKA
MAEKNLPNFEINIPNRRQRSSKQRTTKSLSEVFGVPSKESSKRVEFKKRNFKKRVDFNRPKDVPILQRKSNDSKEKPKRPLNKQKPIATTKKTTKSIAKIEEESDEKKENDYSDSCESAYPVTISYPPINLALQKLAVKGEKRPFKLAQIIEQSLNSDLQNFKLEELNCEDLFLTGNSPKLKNYMLQLPSLLPLNKTKQTDFDDNKCDINELTEQQLGELLILKNGETKLKIGNVLFDV